MRRWQVLARFLNIRPSLSIGPALLVLGVLTSAARAEPASSPPPACHQPEVVRFAIVPQMGYEGEVQQHYEALLRALADELDTRVEMVPTGSYGAVIEGVIDGSIHLAEMGPGAYVKARARGASISPFASLHRQDTADAPATYHAVLLTHQKSKFHSLEDTRGATVSLVDPNSTSGALIPRAQLPKLTGHALEDWFGRISYAGSHDHAINAVLNGRVDTAFVSSGRLQEIQHQGQPAARSLRTLWRSPPIPADPFVYQNSLCQATKAAIHRVFFERKQDLEPFLQRRQRQAFVPVNDQHYQILLAED